MHIKQLIEDEQDEEPKVLSREEPESVSRSSMVGCIEENGFDPQSESLPNASIITEGRRSSGVCICFAYQIILLISGCIAAVY